MYYLKNMLKKTHFLTILWIDKHSQPQIKEGAFMEIPIFSSTHNFDHFLSMFKHYFSNPQYRNFSHYLLGLILCEGKRTISHLSRSQGTHKNYNRLHHFLSDSTWNHNTVNNQRINLFTKIIEKKRTNNNSPKLGFLIVDDTTNPKHGKEMAGYGLNYSSIHDEAIPSQSIVATLYRYDNFDVPMHASLYKNIDYCKKHNETFKTKNELFVEQLNNIKLPKGIRTIALMDSFYFNLNNCKATLKKGIDSIGRLKSNRRLLTSENDRFGINLERWFYALRVHPRTFFKKINIPDSSGKKRELWMLHKRVFIKNLGEIILVMISAKLRGKNVSPIFIGTTATDLSPEEIITLYFKRWAIETFFWTIKERLGFNHHQVRTERATIRHWSLVFFAYSYLVYNKNHCSLTGTLGDIQRLEQKENLKHFMHYLEHNIKKRRRKIDVIHCELAA